MALFIGIDLAGSERRDTGFCVIGPMGDSKWRAHVEILHSDSEILARIKALRGKKLIGIDAPLSLPRGRKSIEEMSPHHFRKCDLALKPLGIRFFPITLGPMRMLAKRGMALKKKIARLSAKAHDHSRVYEVYPGATYDILKIPRKNSKAILRWARRHVCLAARDYSQDELDAIAAALTMKLFLEGGAALAGDKLEGLMVLPLPNANKSQEG